MAVRLQQVVPFGRSLDEYKKLFNLSPQDLQKHILSVADGPASFNAEATRQGASILSIDPIYRFSASEIRQRFDAVVDDIIEQVRCTPNDWVWSYHASPDALKASRVHSLEIFLADFEQGKAEGRYQVGELPNLDVSGPFDLVLCSHFLFLYSDQVSYDLHRDALFALLTLSPEVRIFPLLTLMLERSPYLDPLLQELQASGHQVSIERTAYEFQKGGNEMLVVRSARGC